MEYIHQVTAVAYAAEPQECIETHEHAHSGETSSAPSAAMPSTPCTPGVKVVLSADASQTSTPCTPGVKVVLSADASQKVKPTQASSDARAGRANKRARSPGPRWEHRPREESLASGTRHAPGDRSAGLNALDGDTESDDEIEPEVQRMDDYKDKDDDIVASLDACAAGTDNLVDNAGGSRTNRNEQLGAELGEDACSREHGDTSRYLFRGLLERARGKSRLIQWAGPCKC